jgi:hypothetical protein
MTSDPREAFLLEEYKALRQEMLLKLQHEFDIHKNTTIAVAFVYTVAFTIDHFSINVEDKEIARLIWYLPPLIVLIGAVFYTVYDFVVQKLGMYISSVENQFLADSKPQGWERYFGDGQENPFIGRGNKRFIGAISSPFWIPAFTVTTFVTLIEKVPALKHWVANHIP